MNDLKLQIRKRIELTKYLEDVFVSDAAENFIKSHKNNIYRNNLLLNNKIKYSTYFTRLWLNYMDNNQLGKMLSKKLGIK